MVDCSLGCERLTVYIHVRIFHHVRRYNFFLPDDLDRALDLLKQRDGISESEAIRRALTAYLKRKRIPIRPRKGGARTPKDR